MQLYKHILVTIDCSKVDETIVTHVAALARQNSATVHLLHVVHAHTLDQKRVLGAHSEQCLRAHEKFLSDQGITVEIIMRIGEPDQEILAEIAQDKYDLVAMATHGHKFFGDLLFGSVSDKLKHQIRVPLLLIKADCSG